MSAGMSAVISAAAGTPIQKARFQFRDERSDRSNNRDCLAYCSDISRKFRRKLSSDNDCFADCVSARVKLASASVKFASDWTSPDMMDSRLSSAVMC
jgi:hypothetical protein